VEYQPPLDREVLALERRRRPIGMIDSDLENRMMPEVPIRLELLDRPVRSHEEAVSILKTVPRTDGVLAPTAPSLDITARVLDLAPFVPGVFDTPYWVKGGGLVAYGVDHEVQGRQAARLVARILRGARPEDLPVENSTKFELAINLKTAKQLGLAIPQSLLLRADQVIQ